MHWFYLTGSNLFILSCIKTNAQYNSRIAIRNYKKNIVIWNMGNKNGSVEFTKPSQTQTSGKLNYLSDTSDWLKLVSSKLKL